MPADAPLQASIVRCAASMLFPFIAGALIALGVSAVLAALLIDACGGGICPL